ncbi:hypothetical protein J3A83DRAFT_4357571 [Scleroderma citrinum]
MPITPGHSFKIRWAYHHWTTTSDRKHSAASAGNVLLLQIDDPLLGPHFWPKKDYENIYRFNLSARWAYREERVSLVRKMDWKIMVMVAIGFSALNLDRSNIGQANSSTFTDVLFPTWFLISPVGVFFITMFSLIAITFYTQAELPVRLALFWMSMYLCNIIDIFLAYGILYLDSSAGYSGGLLTLFVGISSFFHMPPFPTQTKTRFRPNGWFINKIFRDDPTKVGNMHNREGLTFGRLWTALCDYNLWPLYILDLMFGVSNNPLATYLTLSFRDIGFNTFETNLLTIPSQALAIVTTFLIGLLSEYVRERTLVSMLEDLWTLPILVALCILPPGPNPWVFFIGWCSRNAGGVASRTVNASLYNMSSSVISAQIYVANERGNRILITICCVDLYYMWRNCQRAKIWDAMTLKYLSTTKDVGNRRLNFRFSH